MARREPIAPLKLAFFVEGDEDKEFIETLAPRVLGPNAVVRVVRVGGKAAFSSTFVEAAFIGADAGGGIRKLAAELPIDLARHRARSFDEFVTGLEAFAPSRARRAS